MSTLQALADLDRVRRRVTLTALTGSGISYGAFGVLDHMDRYDLTRAAVLKRSLNLSSPTVTTLMMRMERDGLILRDPDPEDRRSSVLRMTDHGRARLERGRQAIERVEELVTEEIDPDLLAVVSSVARRMTLNLTEASVRQIRGVEDLRDPDPEPF